MFKACESDALLITVILKHYFFSLCSFIFNFFKSCSLFSQTLIIVLMFSFSKQLTVIFVRNYNNTLMILKFFNSLLSESFSAIKIHEISVLINALYKVLH